MLEIRNLSVDRGKKRILDGVNLRLESGNMTAVIGRNGCGKSTLLSCINQQLSYQGDIFLTGQDLHRMKSKERARQIEHEAIEKLQKLGSSMGLEDFLS